MKYVEIFDYALENKDIKISSVDEVLKDVDQIKNEDDRFKLVSQIGFSYFYAGYSRKSYNLMKNKRKTFSPEMINRINLYSARSKATARRQRKKEKKKKGSARPRPVSKNSRKNSPTMTPVF